MKHMNIRRRGRLDRRLTICAVLIGCTWMIPTSNAVASNGILEINQICATQTGCFPGDQAGYPVTIVDRGSYILTSNLLGSDTTQAMIEVNVSSVSLDLNGFTMACATGVEPNVEDCRSAGANFDGFGIEAALGTTNVSIRNGTVQDMAADGIQLEGTSEVRSVRARNNGFHGIDLNGRGGAVIDCIAESNGVVGIQADRHSLLTGNSAYQNGNDGIFAESGSTFSGNVSSNNGSDGIATNSGSTVQGNTVRSNGGFGLNLAVDAAYGDNTVSANTTGTVNGGLNMSGNSCNGTTTCP